MPRIGGVFRHRVTARVFGAACRLGCVPAELRGREAVEGEEKNAGLFYFYFLRRK